jgi:CheY-like chemotaxis protein
MPEDGSPRPRMMRRLVLAIARAIALFLLVAGLSGALAIGLPNVDPLRRYIAALIVGVIIFESLRPRERRPPVAPDIADAQRRIDELQAEVESRAKALAGLRQQVDRAESELAEAHATADEQERLRKAEADEAGRREREAREKWEAENQHVQRAAGKALEEIQRTRSANEELRAQIERERQNTATLKQAAEAQAADRRKLESQLADLNKRLASASQELDGLRAEQQRSRRELEETRQKADVEKASLRSAVQAEWSAKAQQTSEAHTREVGAVQSEARKLSVRNSELEQQLEQARKNAAAQSGEIGLVQVEIRRLNARVVELQEQLEEARTHAQQLLSASQELTGQLDEERQRFHAELQRLSAEHETKIAEVITTREAAQDEALLLNTRLNELRQQLDEAQQDAADKRSNLELEWSAKLQKIVTELTTDHENEIGDSLSAREAARAETRSLNLKVQDLERQLESARDGRLGLLQRDDQVTQELEAERQNRQRLEQEMASRSHGVDEKAIREKVEAEWSQKLQTIVNHIATDHESDIGKAIEEREAARAEARNLAIKISALQQKLDGERQSRDGLHEKLRAAEQEVAALRTVPPPPPPEPPPPAPEPDEQRARAEVLQFAEQANEVLRRITSPGSVPAPAAEEKKARILFVHHDPALRSLWRENLGKSGFDVHTAVDGLEGLRLAMVEKPDVVIADASMPKMDGRELCQLIKSNQETASVKVILMTGIYTTEAPIDSAAKQFEADELLRKPVKLEAMKSALTSLLAARV